MHKVKFFGKIISICGVQPDPQKLLVLTDVLIPNNKKELQ